MQPKLGSAQTIVYPESDGKPMAETDVHRDLMVDFIQMLQYHFREDTVYVSGNLLIYYEPGNTGKSVAPDVFVVHGVAKKRRRTYLIWEEEKTPDFVLEVSSRSTHRKDMSEKKSLYAEVLEVKEYYIYDPESEIDPKFIGYELIDGVYHELEFVASRLPSSVLGLELGERGGVLRLYNPRTGEWLQPAPERAQQEADARQNAEHRAENAEQRAENAESRAENAESRAQQEADARQNAEARAQNAEAELAQALAELQRRRAQTTH